MACHNFPILDKCILEESAASQRNGPIVFLTMDMKHLKCVFLPKTNKNSLFNNPLSLFHSVTVSCSKDWHNIHIYKDRSKIPPFRSKRQSLHPDNYDLNGMPTGRQKRSGISFASKNITLYVKCIHIFNI